MRIQKEGLTQVVSKNSSVIEINGKRYDAITGKVIGAVKKIAQPATSGSIDGFTKVKAHLSRPAKNHTKRPSSTVHKKPQKSRTLARRGVMPPTPLKNIQKVIHGRSIGSVNPARLTRASAVHKSSKISRYTASVINKAPSMRASTHQAREESNHVQNTGSMALSKPLPSMVTSVSHQRLERMLDEALAKADAHKQMLKQLQKRSWWQKLNFLPHWATVAIVTIVSVTALAFFAWERVPQLSLKMAASKAKISASVPAYKPEGFAVSGPVKYQSGAVVMNYSSAGKEDYSLSQKASDWDSVSLAANAIPTGSPVQTSQVKGTTVYIYGATNDAAWVNNGIKYNLKNKANLSSDQIIKIANSL